MESGGAGFSAAVTLVFGLFSWLQFPALCGFMFSSTRAGADNFRYSLILGGFLGIVGLFSGLLSAMNSVSLPGFTRIWTTFIAVIASSLLRQNGRHPSTCRQ